MPRPNRRYDNPHYDLARVHAAARDRDVAVTDRARADAERVLPSDIVDLDLEISEIVRSLVRDEFEFSETQTRQYKGRSFVSVVDVYRIDFENRDLWLKLKIEQDLECLDVAVVISFHEWDDTRET